jgi:outer membrane protein OmpU
MKKILMATTALVGVLALAPSVRADEHKKDAATSSPITVTVGGVARFNAGLTNQDLRAGTTTQDHSFEHDAEVFIGVFGKTDGGLEYGAKVELTRGDVYDDNQTYIYAQGDFGRLEVGDYAGAADRLTVRAPRDFATGGVEGDYVDFLDAKSANIGTYYTNLSGLDKFTRAFDSHDATKITYFTPKFYGLQAGVSYVPDGELKVGSSIANDKKTKALANFTGDAADASDFNNFIEAGLSFNTEISGFDLGLSGTYVTADAKKNTPVNGDFEDISAFSAGASIGYMGFTLGGGYVDNGDSGQLKNAANKKDSTGWNAGLQYETGPFIVGVNAQWAKTAGENTNTRDETLDAYSVGATYKVAPGLRTYAEATMFEYTSGNTAATDNEGQVFIIGTALDF